MGFVERRGGVSTGNETRSDAFASTREAMRHYVNDATEDFVPSLHRTSEVLTA